MNPALFKHVKTTRGHTYHYHLTPPAPSSQANKAPTILLLQAFSCTDWSPQIAHFTKKLGYQTLAVDLLGFGKTSKPADAKEYRATKMANDVVEILDHERIGKVIAVGHGSGSLLVSRLVHIYPNRLAAVAFLSVGYTPPQPGFDYEAAMGTMKEMFGSDLIGYWELFASKDGPGLCAKNLDSFYSLLFPRDPSLWKTDLAPRGKARAWVQGNRQAGFPKYWSDAERRAHQARLVEGGGLEGFCNWYRCRVLGHCKNDELNIRDENVAIRVPTFYGAGVKDNLCLPDNAVEVMKHFMVSGQATLKVEKFESAGHWLVYEVPEQLNRALEKFILSVRKY